MNRTLEHILKEHLEELPMNDAYVLYPEADKELLQQLDELLSAIEELVHNYTYDGEGHYITHAAEFGRVIEAYQDLNT